MQVNHLHQIVLYDVINVICWQPLDDKNRPVSEVDCTLMPCSYLSSYLPQCLFSGLSMSHVDVEM